MHDYTALAPRLAARRRPQNPRPGRPRLGSTTTPSAARESPPASPEVDPELLVALVNHELRTPLTMMVGYAEMMRCGDAGELSEEQALMVGAVERGAARVQELVLDLLTLATHAITEDQSSARVADAVRRLAGDVDVATD